MRIKKENFGGKIKGKFRDAKKNEKVQKVASRIESAERKFSFPNTMTGFVLSAGGGAMLWHHIPFASEVFWFGASLLIAGIGFKLNRKLLGKEGTNKIEKVLIDLIKVSLKK